MIRVPVYWRNALSLAVCLVSIGCGSGEQPKPAADGDQDERVPPEQQILRLMTPEPLSLDSSIRPYDTRGTILPFEPLLRRGPWGQPQAGAAERYESSPDGMTWTFHLRPGAKWSDGRPVTADDVVFSYRRFVDPASANIYAFFYYDILNATAINHGTLTDLTQLGVRAVDSLTVEIRTAHPSPYLPYIVSFGDAFLAPHWAIEKYGVKWTEAGNIVTNAAYTIREWEQGSHMTFVPNAVYNGPHTPILQEVRYTFREPGSATLLPYENNEVDIDGVDINDLERIRQDPNLSRDLVKINAMGTWYLFFRTQQAPFNDVKVREAFSRAIDREGICQTVLRGAADPAYGMLPPGFKNYDGERFKAVQGFDSARAAQLMAEAGYPGGRGFPKQELWLRAPGSVTLRVAAAVQDMLKKQLGVDITIRSLDDSAYMNNLFAWKMNLGMLDFGADFPDPRNMLDMIWRSQPVGSGRQDWTNAGFDELIDQARVTLEPNERSQKYKQAEEILVSDFGGVFLHHPAGLRLIKPWVRGYLKEKNGTVWMDLDLPSTIYITKH